MLIQRSSADRSLSPWSLVRSFVPSMLYDPLHLRSLRNRDPEARLRRCFGFPIYWRSFAEGGRHLEEEQLEPYRQIGDPLVDEIFQLFREEGQPVGAAMDLVDACPDGPSPATRAVAELLRYHSQVPHWVDWDQIERGQRVFLAYSPAIGASLFYRSLVPGFAIPKIAAVLQATAYLAPPSSREQVHSRLMDTGAFLALCMGVDALRPAGDGWKAALRVRLLHAKVRDGLLRRRGARQWNSQELGIPINQEDMAATLLAFSTNSLWGAEMLLFGFPLPESERRDYLALWRYIGWLLGIETTTSHGQPSALDPCGPGWIPHRPDSIAHSDAVFQSMLCHLLTPDESSVSIAHHLLWIGRQTDAPKGAREQRSRNDWFYFRCLQCRRFIGNEGADALKLPMHPNWLSRCKLWIFSQMYLTLLSIYTIAALPSSPFRKWIINMHKCHMVRFLDHWNEDHQKRMVRQTASSCPFAMVAAPIGPLS